MNETPNSFRNRGAWRPITTKAWLLETVRGRQSVEQLEPLD